MKQIAIGTCIPGQKALEYLPHMVDKGFERFEICFHMEFYGVEIPEEALGGFETVEDVVGYIEDRF